MSIGAVLTQHRSAFLIRLALLVAFASLAFLLGASAGPDWRAAAAFGAVGSVVVLIAALIGRRPKPEPSGRAAAPPTFVAEHGDGLPRYDTLTGLPTATVFHERLAAVLRGARRIDRRAAVLHVDIADFKRINDTLGRVAGDVLLRHTGIRLLATLRETDMVARMGRDEFAIVVAGLEDPAGVVAVCERLIATMAEPFDLCGHLTHARLRIGAAVFPGDAEEPEHLLECAAAALGRVGADAVPSFRLFDDALMEASRERETLRRDLANAFEGDRLELEYLPQFDIATRRMVGAEVLPRWHHPERGSVPADQLVALAEDGGLILPLGRWMLEHACRTAAHWQRRARRGLRVTLGVSPSQVRDPDFGALVGAALEHSGLAAGHLQLEITGRVLAEDAERGLRILRQMQARGVRISISGLGSSSSSLDCLRRFPFDQIKLDGSLIGALPHDRAAAAIAHATVSLARSLGIDAAAEGVETAEQVAFLDTAGCRLVQGHHFSRAVHAREIESMLDADLAAAEAETINQHLAVTR